MFQRRKTNQENFSSRCSRILFWKSAAASNQRTILKHNEPTNLRSTICPRRHSK
ncbi:hypothetical protein CEXT_34561, partial [Caerostris extrusa]